ncbi:MAG TPA: hypothetical protein ENK86_04895 [Campylobacterales bacterium]|nr:hypothetical protein [Campylobacterales bacterium]
MDRREFVALMSLLFAGCQSTQTSNTRQTENATETDTNSNVDNITTTRSIIVIGAGLAGLAAAQKLQWVCLINVTYSLKRHFGIMMSTG